MQHTPQISAPGIFYMCVPCVACLPSMICTLLNHTTHGPSLKRYSFIPSSASLPLLSCSLVPDLCRGHLLPGCWCLHHPRLAYSLHANLAAGKRRVELCRCVALSTLQLKETYTYAHCPTLPCAALSILSILPCKPNVQPYPWTYPHLEYRGPYSFPVDLQGRLQLERSYL